MQDKQLISIKAINQADQVNRFYLHLDGPQGLPLELGTGRNAVVFLATTTPYRESEANDYRAIKFLRDDIDKQYARASAVRFFQEADKAKRFDRLQGTFVKYFGWGAIGKPGSLDEKDQHRDFWWYDQFGRCVQELAADDEAHYKELARIQKHFNLQGPFYVLDLCQGTLYDLLDKNTPWEKLPAYSISTFHSSLLSQSDRIHRDIETITEKYLQRSPAGRSGYDILNDFKDEPTANTVRSRAVLEVFQQIAHTVSQLHKKKELFDLQTGRRKAEPLAHRDLKPGNIFFQHDANIEGLHHITLQLSDLGYVTNADQIISGDVTLRAGRKGAEYQAPGSQFYRAPEQAELPIEVRVDIDEQTPNEVSIRGSKINQIEIHDWLSLSDIFNDEKRSIDEDTSLFKILDVTHCQDEHGIFYRLKLDNTIKTSKTNDTQGQVIRATGFQTDGFSLGAMLYDLISGGKDPQLFYTYCIVSLTSQFERDSYDVDDIVEVLAPERKEGIVASEELNLSERRRMLVALMGRVDLDRLFDIILEIAFSKETFTRREKLSFNEKRKLAAQVLSVGDIDDLVLSLIQSPLFMNGLHMPEDHASGQTARERLTEKLKNYRFRHFHLVSNLLKDKRGVNIPKDILTIIVRCMVRDVPGAYYLRDQEHGFTWDANFEAATRIHDDVQRLLGEQQYRLPSTGFPKSLEDNLLFKLRSLARKSLPQQAEVASVRH